MIVAEPLVQRSALGLALAFTSLGIVLIGVVPIDAPQPPLLDQALLKQLRQQGWKVQSSVAAEGRPQLSNGVGVVLTQPESASSDNAQLSLIPIRTRSNDQLGAESIGTAVFGESPQNGSTFTIQGDQFFRFRDSKKRQLASSCIAFGKASSSEEEMTRAIGNPSSSWLERLQTTVGLQPLRDWSCLFTVVSVADVDKAEGDQAIRRVWAQLQPTLTGSTSSESTLSQPPGSVGIR
jgi:hypothetical protein